MGSAFPNEIWLYTFRRPLEQPPVQIVSGFGRIIAKNKFRKLLYDTTREIYPENFITFNTKHIGDVRICKTD